MDCGLVLSGGGGRGAYQIGCWRALKEHGFVVKSVAGISVGGLNAALVGLDDVELATAIWRNTTNHRVYHWDVAHWLRAPLDGAGAFAGHSREVWRQRRWRAPLHLPVFRTLADTVYRRGVFNTQRGLRELIAEFFDADRLRNSPARIWITTLRARGWLPWRGDAIHFDLKTLPDGEMRDVLLASASPPFLFPAVRHHRRWLADAGWATVTPIAPVYGDGARLIFVLHLRPGQRTNPAAFPGARIIDLAPREEIGTMLGFHPELSERNLELGYADCGLRISECGLKVNELRTRP